jgi:saccharopine dehydrogenase-like NADP-dependent oxidoreductase
LKKIVVLGGAGAMGQIIVRDLAESADIDSVVIADFNLASAEKLKNEIGGVKVSAVFADLTKHDQLVTLLTGATLVINSTPYYFNVNVMEAALQAACHYMDLGGLFHVTKKQLELNEKFKHHNLLAVLGMGAAPGMTNVMAAEGAEELDRVDSIDIYVGCVDFVQVDHPLAPPYALDTILDEYTKEPMVFEEGEYRAKPPMSGEVTVDFPAPVGQAKAILTLHSEVLTLPLTYASKGIKSVTFRLGLPTEFHEKLKLLVDLGFGATEPIEVQGTQIVPRKVLAKMIEKFPIPAQTPDDCEVIRVDVKGAKGGAEKLVRLESIIYADKKWKVSCGALDTGVPPSIVAQMIAKGAITAHGVLAPEECVPRKPFFDELAKRNIVVNKNVQQAKASLSVN